MSKKLYEILGLSKDASQIEIKKAYRKLSLEFHPDRNNSPDAQSKFQEINSAYEILGDNEKKEQYDMEQSGFQGGMHFSHNMDETSDIGNIFNMLFGLHGGLHGGLHSGGGGMPPGMGMMHPGMPQGMPNIRIFHGGQIFQQQQSKPPPILKNIQLSLEQCYTGCSVPLEIERWIYNGDIKCSELETIYLTIPPGIDDNESIMIVGKGNAINNELKGDIRVSVQIENNTLFIRRGLDLHYKKTVSLKEALCGFAFDLNHINGKTFCLNNNTNHTIIKPNYKKTIPSLGMHRENIQGSLIIEFEVEFPDSLSKEQIEELKKHL